MMITILAWIAAAFMALNAIRMVTGPKIVDRVAAALGLALFTPLILRVLGFL